MARAIAKCECEKCGKEFEKIKRDCRNRSEADSWEGWASNYYTLCDDCRREQYRQVQEETAKNNGLKVIRVKYSEYKSKYNDCAQIKDSYDKETKTIEIYVKEDLYEERIEKQQKEEELKAIQTKMVVDYSLYKNYFSSIPSVRDSYSSKYREITLLVTPTQRQEIEDKIKYLEDLEKQREDIEVDYKLYQKCIKEHFKYSKYNNGKVTLHLLPHNIVKVKELIEQYEKEVYEKVNNKVIYDFLKNNGGRISENRIYFDFDLVRETILKKGFNSSQLEKNERNINPFYDIDNDKFVGLKYTNKPFREAIESKLEDNGLEDLLDD